MRLFICILTLVFSCAWAEIVETFYGNMEVEEPVLLELIHSPAFERMKHLHQYGVSYYINAYPEEYTRHAHSLGVFAILRAKNAPLEEQIAGLLHDISHTVFSHVGDWVFGKGQGESDYQTSIHSAFLVECGLEEILNRHGYTVEQVSPNRKEFQMLEQPLPNLCADRIDYNIQGAYFQHFLSYEEALRLFDHVRFESGKWVIPEEDLAIKLARFSLHMTEHCWGSALNWMTSQWLAEAIHQGLKEGVLTMRQLHHGTDQEVWERLCSAEDPYIQHRMQMLRFPDRHFLVVNANQAERFLPFKCRGINPWVVHNGKTVRLTSVQPELEEALHDLKERALQGWPVKELSPS